jgi:hypothetical protein
MTIDERQDEKEEHLFLVFFLYDDRDLNVRVEEAETIDLREVTEHLDLGGSVFITHRRNPETTHHKGPDPALPEGGAAN